MSLSSEIIDQSPNKADTISTEKSKLKEDRIMETKDISNDNDTRESNCQQQNNNLQVSADEQNNDTSNDIDSTSQSVRAENETLRSETDNVQTIKSNTSEVSGKPVTENVTPTHDLAEGSDTEQTDSAKNTSSGDINVDNICLFISYLTHVIVHLMKTLFFSKSCQVL